MAIEHTNVTPIEHLTGKPFTFGIYAKKHAAIYLMASSQAEMDHWMKELEKIVSQRKKKEGKKKKEKNTQGKKKKFEYSLFCTCSPKKIF